jgi:hypothetical protein
MGAIYKGYMSVSPMAVNESTDDLFSFLTAMMEMNTRLSQKRVGKRVVNKRIYC